MNTRKFVLWLVLLIRTKGLQLTVHGDSLPENSPPEVRPRKRHTSEICPALAGDILRRFAPTPSNVFSDFAAPEEFPRGPSRDPLRHYWEATRVSMQRLVYLNNALLHLISGLSRLLHFNKLFTLLITISTFTFTHPLYTLILCAERKQSTKTLSRCSASKQAELAVSEFCSCNL